MLAWLRQPSHVRTKELLSRLPPSRLLCLRFSGQPLEFYDTIWVWFLFLRRRVPHLLSGWPKKSSNFIFTTKMIFPKRLKFMNSGSEVPFFGAGSKGPQAPNPSLLFSFGGALKRNSTPTWLIQIQVCELQKCHFGKEKGIPLTESKLKPALFQNHAPLGWILKGHQKETPTS